MADSIKIPIELLTKGIQQDLAELNKTVKSLNTTVSKNAELQTKAVRRTRKEISFLSAEYRALGVVATGLGGIILAQNKQLRQLVVNFLNLNPVVDKASKGLAVYSKGIAANGRLVLKLREAILGTVDITGQLGKAFFVLDRGLVGLSLNLATVSGALFGLSKGFDLFNNEVAETIADLLLLGAIVTGSLSAALVALIRLVGSLAVKIGNELVGVAREATQAFVEFQKKTFIFERTIKGFNKAFGDSIGTVESWTKTIKGVSEETAFTEKALRGAVTEIVATTSAMGFNEEQQKKLLAITSDYARFLGDDVVQTTIEFISALNGQAQSVQKYGVKLGATNLQQKLYSQGVQQSFNTLSEAEKVQIRWNSLLSQSIPIQGTAADVTKTLAGQQKVLNNNILRLSQSFGEGAAIIENNNLVAAGLNLILNNISESTLKVAGFFTSFAGRVLQVAGNVLLLSFNLLAVIKSIKIINILLSTQLAKNLVSLPIPLVNQSLTQLIKNSGAAFVSFKSLSDILKTFGSVLLNQFKVFASALLGVQVGAVSFSAILKASVVKALTAVKTATLVLSRAWLVLAKNPIFIAIKIASLVLLGLYQAFKIINDVTGVFNELWNDLLKAFSQTTSVFASVVKLFTNFRNTLLSIAQKVIGFFIFALSKALQAIFRLIDAISKFSLFSKAFASVGIEKEQIGSFEKAANKLEIFSDQLFESDFQVNKLAKSTSRSIASINNSIAKVDLKPLKDLEEELKDVGLTDLDILKRQRNERLKIIEEGLKSEGKAYELAVKLKEKIETDFNLKKGELEKQANDEARKREKERLDWLESFRKETLDLEKNIRGIVGRIGQSASQAIQFAFGGGKSELELDLDLKLDKLQERLDKDLITEAEFDIEKKSLDKQRKDLEKNTSIAFGAGLLNGLVQGAKGAEDIIVSSLQAGLDVFVPGLGEALGPLLKVFAQGPEETKKFINEFVQSLPIIIENIILSIPALIEAIADNIDIIIIALVDRVDDIIIALVRAMPRVAAKLALALSIQVPLALIKSLPSVVIELVKAYAKEFPAAIIRAFKEAFSKLGTGIFKSLGKLIFDGFITALTGGFNILGSLFKKIFKFDGGGRGAVEKFLGFDFPFIAFSQGGMVGGSARVSGDSSLNDTVPALLSAGEIVLPRSAVKNGASGIIGFLQGLGVNIPRFGLGGFVEGLVGGLGGILGGVFGGLGSLVSGGVGLVSDIFSPVGSLVDHAYGYLQQFEEFVSFPKKWTDILKSLAMIGAEISLKELFKNPFEAITQAVKGALGFFQDSFRQMLKGGLPFAQGGMVPRGFNNDTFNARLSSGEYVIDRSLTGRLSDYLDAQKPQFNGSSMTVVDLLSKILSTMQSEKTINTSVDFNGDTLANIILELNRSNARMA